MTALQQVPVIATLPSKPKSIRQLSNKVSLVLNPRQSMTGEFSKKLREYLQRKNYRIIKEEMSHYLVKKSSESVKCCVKSTKELIIEFQFNSMLLNINLYQGNSQQYQEVVKAIKFFLWQLNLLLLSKTEEFQLFKQKQKIKLMGLSDKLLTFVKNGGKLNQLVGGIYDRIFQICERFGETSDDQFLEIQEMVWKQIKLPEIYHNYYKKQQKKIVFKISETLKSSNNKQLLKSLSMEQLTYLQKDNVLQIPSYQKAIQQLSAINYSMPPSARLKCVQTYFNNLKQVQAQNVNFLGCQHVHPNYLTLSILFIFYAKNEYLYGNIKLLESQLGNVKNDQLFCKINNLVVALEYILQIWKP